jgi:hypothetical protein
MKFSIADIVITNLRTRLKLILLTGTTFLAMMLRGLSVPCVAPSKMFNRFAFNVVFPWVDTSAPNASSSMTMYQKSNTIAMNVAYAELEVKRTFSTATNVNVAIHRR